jgi:hypothetical protein
MGERAWARNRLSEIAKKLQDEGLSIARYNLLASYWRGLPGKSISATLGGSPARMWGHRKSA